MRRREIAVLCVQQLNWDRLSEHLPKALEGLGLSPDESGADGQLVARDLGEDGCQVMVESASLARRAGLALARRCGAPIRIYEVVGTAGSKRFHFRTAAYLATPAGELKEGEGKELDLEDPEQQWGGGGLLERSDRVLREFASIDAGARRSVRLGFKKRPAARPSSPRVATLLASLKQAKSHQATPQEGGRVELRIELATGGRQISLCSAAEHEELERLLGSAP